MEKLISPKRASKILGVHPVTLINWEKEGKISCMKTLGGHRRYKFDEIKKIWNEMAEKDKPSP